MRREKPLKFVGLVDYENEHFDDVEEVDAVFREYIGEESYY